MYLKKVKKDEDSSSRGKLIRYPQRARNQRIIGPEFYTGQTQLEQRQWELGTIGQGFAILFIHWFAFGIQRQLLVGDWG
jgi:hypothetical protein